ncbi:hypothetical protein GCM10023113_22240 [Cellulomonas oligotrophica]|uniref:Lipoprotein n=1 Tax=Cellulomonas oligotrophica TaxID=931536 RepID=A0ABQ4DCA5_9CELL|nr:hypothetical protein Col01nite_25170 [Cellulomonas oligotrophica]
MLVAALVLITGCSTGAPEPPDVTCTTAPPGPVGAEEAAVCLYEGWVATDEALVDAYGAPGVTDALPVAVDDPQMRWGGCTGAGSETPDGVVCTWTGAFSDGPVTIELAATGTDADGYRVTAVTVVR